MPPAAVTPTDPAPLAPTSFPLDAALRLAAAIRASGVVVVDDGVAQHLRPGPTRASIGAGTTDIGALVERTGAPVVFVRGAGDRAASAALDALERRGVRMVRVGGGDAFSARLGSAALALALLCLVAPLLLVAGLLVRLDSPGPATFAQDRLGRDGRRIRIPKLRTMATAADPYARSPYDDHPHLTRLGRLLRPTGLDELPQLACVVAGTMALVGPRPEMPFVVDAYTPIERLRLLVRPGITGLWQLHGDRSRAIHEQIEYDLAYLATRSAALDARILLETARYALGTLLRLRRRVLPSSARIAPPVVLPADDTVGTG